MLLHKCQSSWTRGRNTNHIDDCDLQRIQFEAEQKVAQAKGEAESIRIQSEAIQQNGGEAYLRMKTIERWNGALPQYVGAGNPMSMFSLNK